MRIKRGVRFLTCTVLCLVLLAAVRSGWRFRQPQETENLFSFFQNSPQEWNLVLVNAQNPLPDSFSIELTQLSNGESVDSRMYPALQKMFDDMRAQGIYPTVNEGYRTREEQQSVLDDKIAAYEAEGYSEEDARDMALDYVALPGTSEHELGLAVDIIADKSRSSNETVYSWLEQNAYLYGFILRYPAVKESVTGISYEPWHYRYVGEEAAKEMYESGLCLEEYLQQLS